MNLRKKKNVSKSSANLRNKDRIKDKTVGNKFIEKKLFIKLYFPFQQIQNSRFFENYA